MGWEMKPELKNQILFKWTNLWSVKTKRCHLAPFVGATGFEPTTSTSRTWRATGLRYAPKNSKTAKLSIQTSFPIAMNLSF